MTWMNLGLERCDCQCHDIKHSTCDRFNCCDQKGVKKDGFTKPVYKEVGKSKPTKYKKIFEEAVAKKENN